MVNQAFPALSGVVDAEQLRGNLSGLIARNTAGVARAGVFPRHTDTLVSGTGGLAYAVEPFEGVVLVDGEPAFISLRGSESVQTDPPPATNSRIDLICVRQGPTTPELFVVKGAAAANPTRPTVPVGAIELGSAQMTANSSNTSGLTFTNSAVYTTTSGGVLLVTSQAQMDAWTPANGAIVFRVDEGWHARRIRGAWIGPRGISANLSGGNQSIPNGAATVLSYGSRNLQGGVTFATQGSGHRFIVPVAGWYHVSMTGRWASATGGPRVVRVNTSAGMAAANSYVATDSYDPFMTAGGEIYLPAGGWIQFEAIQQRPSGALNFSVDNAAIVAKD